MIGIFSVHLSLNEPLVTIAHQLVAALLVAFLSALSSRRPIGSAMNIHFDTPVLEVCHG